MRELEREKESEREREREKRERERERLDLADLTHSAYGDALADSHKYIFIFTPPLSARTLGDDSCWIEAFFALKVRISVLNEENYQ